MALRLNKEGGKDRNQMIRYQPRKENLKHGQFSGKT